ncbi:MAG: hypothetical protein ACLVJ6_05475 [Merdibacter sp.]
MAVSTNYRSSMSSCMPYIINLANTLKPETYELAVDFLRQELV